MSYNKETGMYEGFIYKIWNEVNDKVYISQTTVSILHRWGQHLSKKKGDHGMIIYSAMEKYGRKNFHIEEIEKHSAPDRYELLNILNDREVYYIALLNSLTPNGYNISLGGNNNDYKKTPIDVYNRDGTLLAECESIFDTHLKFDIATTSIASGCLGESVSRNGLVFRYHGDPFDKYRTKLRSELKRIPVYKFSLDGRLIDEYNSISEAGRKNDIDVSDIMQSLYKRSRTTAGFYWSTQNVFDYDPSLTFHVPEPNRIPVVAYSKSGELIGKYPSQLDAAKHFGFEDSASSIKYVCNGEWSSSHGIVWRYEGDPFDKYPVNGLNSKRGGFKEEVCKPVDCYDQFGNYIVDFKSISDAAAFFGISIGMISHCINGDVQICNGGYIFRYKNHPLEEFKFNYTRKYEIRHIDVYELNGNYIQMYNNWEELIDKKVSNDGRIWCVFECCNGKRKSYNKKIFRWHGDSFENPGSIDTYPHPDYQKLFEENPDATRDDVINLLKQSLDNVGIYAVQNQQVA